LVRNIKYEKKQNTRKKMVKDGKLMRKYGWGEDAIEAQLQIKYGMSKVIEQSVDQYNTMLQMQEGMEEFSLFDFNDASDIPEDLPVETSTLISSEDFKKKEEKIKSKEE